MTTKGEFLGIGAFAALVNRPSRMFLTLAMPLGASIVCAYMVSMTSAYTLIGVVGAMITSYFGHRYFSCAQEKTKPVP